MNDILAIKIRNYRNDFSHALKKYNKIDNHDLFWINEKFDLFVKLIF